MNVFRKILLKAQNRELYDELRLEERNRAFLAKANDNTVIFPTQKKAVYTFKHSGNAGDIIYALPSVYALAEKATAEIYLQLDQPMPFSVERGRHPLNGIMLNRSMYSMLRPLLLAQPKITRCEIYNGQPEDFDLDVFRKSPLHTNAGHIARWYFLLFGVNADLGKPWIQATPNRAYSESIVIARSLGHHAPGIDYSFLKNYRNLIFVGLPEEFNAIRSSLPAIEYRPVKDFLDLAEVIAGCRFFIGNQSFPFSLAEALKVRRALEVYYSCPNVIVEGSNGFDFCFQPQFERIVRKLDELP